MSDTDAGGKQKSDSIVEEEGYPVPTRSTRDGICRNCYGRVKLEVQFDGNGGFEFYAECHDCGRSGWNGGEDSE